MVVLGLWEVTSVPLPAVEPGEGHNLERSDPRPGCWGVRGRSGGPDACGKTRGESTVAVAPEHHCHPNPIYATLRSGTTFPAVWGRSSSSERSAIGSQPFSASLVAARSGAYCT